MLQVKLSDSHLTVLIVSVWRTERLFGIQRRRKIWHEDRTCESAHANVSTSQTTWHANMCKCAFHFDFTHSHDVDKHTSIKKIITRNITYRYLSWLLIALFFAKRTNYPLKSWLYVLVFPRNDSIQLAPSYVNNVTREKARKNSWTPQQKVTI